MSEDEEIEIDVLTAFQDYVADDPEQRDEALHTPRSMQGERSVETLRDGPQHREGGSGGYGAIAKEGPEGPIASSKSLRCS